MACNTESLPYFAAVGWGFLVRARCAAAMLHCAPSALWASTSLVQKSLWHGRVEQNCAWQALALLSPRTTLRKMIQGFAGCSFTHFNAHRVVSIADGGRASFMLCTFAENSILHDLSGYAVVYAMVRGPMLEEFCGLRYGAAHLHTSACSSMFSLRPEASWLLPALPSRHVCLAHLAESCCWSHLSADLALAAWSAFFPGGEHYTFISRTCPAWRCAPPVFADPRHGPQHGRMSSVKCHHLFAQLRLEGCKFTGNT